MSQGPTAEQLYYSPEAVARFAELEDTVRRRQLRYMQAMKLPEVAEMAEYVDTEGDAVIGGAMFGAWQDRTIQEMLKTAHGEELLRRIYYVGNYAAATALAAGQEVEVELLPWHGHIMIPECGRIAIAGSDNRFARVEVSDGITVTAGRETVHIAQSDILNLSPAPNWEPLRYIGPPDFRIALNDIDPNRDIFRWPPAARLDDAQYARWHITFSNAWDFIQEHDPTAAAIVRASLNTIVPAPAEPLTHGKSMAAGAGFGAIGINEHRDPQRLASHIIYGTRKHMAIALRGEQPDMYAPETDPLATKSVYPPSREGHGIAHHLLDDSFINIGLARFFAEVVTNARPDLQEYAQLSFTRWFVESQQNLESLRACGYVTPANAHIVDALEQEAAALAHLYWFMPESIKQAIDTNVRDRALSWRMHNITPDARAVQYLRGAWLRGEPCPPIMIAGELSPSIDAYTHIGQRTRYVLKESSVKDPHFFEALKNGQPNPKRFGTPTPGDIAFASGNIRGARSYFAAAIRNRPDSQEAWAGFALTYEHDRSAAAELLSAAPELAAALYTAIGDPNLSPESVAAWAANCRVATAIDT